jgi:glutamyl-tRNA synthetase
MVGFLLADEVEIDPAGAAKVLDAEGRAFLDAATKVLEAVEPWTAEAIETALRNLQAERGLKPKKAFQPIRLAITGTLVSPPLFESMELLGKARSLARLERARAYPG